MQPDLLLGGKYGHQMHVWDLRRRRHLQALDLGNEQQMVLEMRPAHDPTKAYGFRWRRRFCSRICPPRSGSGIVTMAAWGVKKVIEIPAEPADPEKLPPMLKDFKAVPPLVTDINLSLDDKFLYVSCWGTGEFLQYDVSGSVQSEEDRLSAHWRHCQSHAAPEETRPAAGVADRKWWK